jgi:hypothetical protein
VRPGTAVITATSGTLSATASGTTRSPTIQVETGTSVTASIGEAGGAVTALAANGTQFTLTVPAFALETNTDITLTPVTSIEHAPVGTTIVAAVRMRPDALTLLNAAALTIELPAPPGTGVLFGIRFGDDGSPLWLAPLDAQGTTLSMPITHFSGAGAGSSPACSTLPAAPLAGTPRDKALADIALAELKHQCTGTWDVTLITTALQTWYATGVKPNLTAMATGGSTSAFGEWAEWKTLVLDYTAVFVQNAGLTAAFAEGQTLAVAAVKAEIGRKNQQCTTNRDLQAAEKVFYWQRQAQDAGIGTTANGLDLATIKGALCVSIELEATDFPATVQQGTPATLLVRAGLRFGTQSVSYTPALRVTITSTGAGPATDTKNTNGSGEASFTVTPSASGSAVSVHVRVSPNVLELENQGLSKEATLNRTTSSASISMTPTAALLDPGTQATFTATVTGIGNTAVTWTVQGGTISPPSGSNTVVYTAGSVPGQFNLTATSVADPSKSATAVIHVALSNSGVVTIDGGSVQATLSHQLTTALTSAVTCNDANSDSNLPFDSPLSVSKACTSGTGIDALSASGTATVSSSVSGGTGHNGILSVSFAGSGEVSASSAPSNYPPKYAQGAGHFMASISFEVTNGDVQYTISGSAAGIVGNPTQRQQFAAVQVILLKSGVGLLHQIDAGMYDVGSSPPYMPPANINWTGTLSPGDYSVSVNAYLSTYGGITNRFAPGPQTSSTASANFNIAISTTPAPAPRVQVPDEWTDGTDSEIAVETDRPDHPGFKPATAQRHEGVGEEDWTARRPELHAERSVRAMIVDVGNVGGRDHALDRMDDGYGVRQRQRAGPHLPLGEKVGGQRRPVRDRLVEAQAGENGVIAPTAHGIAEVEMRREVTEPRRRQHQATHGELAGTGQVLLGPGGEARIGHEGQAGAFRGGETQLGPDRHVPEPGGRPERCSAGREYGVGGIAGEEVRRGNPEREELAGAAARHARVHHRNGDAHVQPVCQPEGGEERGHEQAEVEIEAHLEDVVFTERQSHPLGLHVVMREVEDDLVERHAAKRHEAEPGHVAANDEPALAQGLGALAENRT